MAIETRAEHKNKKKQAKQEKKETRRARKKEKQYVRRIVPIWLKVLIVIVLSLFALMIGLIVGFSVFGDGNPLDVLKWETWQHIIDFVRSD